MTAAVGPAELPLPAARHPAAPPPHLRPLGARPRPGALPLRAAAGGSLLGRLPAPGGPRRYGARAGALPAAGEARGSAGGAEEPERGAEPVVRGCPRPFCLSGPFPEPQAASWGGLRGRAGRLLPPLGEAEPRGAASAAAGVPRIPGQGRCRGYLKLWLWTCCLYWSSPVTMGRGHREHIFLKEPLACGNMP